MRHAMVDLGGGFHLHPFEIPNGSEGTGSDQMFGRGHLDHLAITITDPGDFALVRARLVELGATDGALVDFGPIRAVWFTDPDGMGCELATHGSGEPRTFEDRVVEAFAAT